MVIDHTYIGDLTITVQHNGQTVTLWDHACSDQSYVNLDIIFDDEGSPLDQEFGGDCANPTSGTYTPSSCNGDQLALLDTLDAEFAGELHVGYVDEKGAVRERSDMLEAAYALGKQLLGSQTTEEETITSSATNTTT